MFNIVPQHTKKTIQESKMIMNVKLKKIYVHLFPYSSLYTACDIHSYLK
ncbi:hypothetical protein JOE44_003235 [Chryseobacterium sp. PvR013]|nr:hypothetical protein [Chryseobacterium sp. PvR013]